MYIHFKSCYITISINFISKLACHTLQQTPNHLCTLHSWNIVPKIYYRDIFHIFLLANVKEEVPTTNHIISSISFRWLNGVIFIFGPFFMHMGFFKDHNWRYAINEQLRTPPKKSLIIGLTYFEATLRSILDYL